MNILALNSSPRTGGRSKTELMLDRLVEGMRDAGARVEVVNLREKKINNCVGCYTCWTKTPGKCIHKDDMSGELFPKWLESDLVVYATPLYYHTMNSAMSRFKERTLPAALPFIEMGDEKSTHPLRHKVPPAVWLSVCGFPELTEFDVFSDYLHRTLHEDVEIWAEIYRPAAESMSTPLFRETVNDILDATKRAGWELAETREVSPETMARIAQPICEREQIADLANMFWRTCIAEEVSPKEFDEKGIVPRPYSMDTFMLVFPYGLNREAAGDGRVLMQFTFTGEVEGQCWFAVEKGNVKATVGTCDNPDIAITTSFGVWMDIMTRKADGQQMFMEGKYRVEGDLNLMIELFKEDDTRS